MSFALQLVANGIVFSCVIILGAIGLSLVYSIANFANFAHGDLMTVGAFAAVVVHGGFVKTGVPMPETSVLGLPVWFYLATILAMGVGAFVAVATERIVYRPLDTTRIGLLITSIGVALTYRALVFFGFGPGQRNYPVGSGGPIPEVRGAFDISVTQSDVAIVALTVVLVASLHAILQYTTLGRKMRATADNPELARVSGIRTMEVITAMWIIGGALAAAGGVFLGLDLLVRPTMGFDILLVVFAAVILGGIGSVYGAMLGGVAIGMAHEMTPLLPFVGSEYDAAVAFVIMVGILLVRPEGIAGGGKA